MFATCSKDGFVNVNTYKEKWLKLVLNFLFFYFQVWNAGYPSTIKYSHNMKDYSWKYTQFSQFNQSDTLLLVSGVHFGC